MNLPPCVVSVSEHAGWTHVVSVAASGPRPVVVGRRRIPTIAPGLPTMPYHHESLRLPEGDANALIARVRSSIVEWTTSGLRLVLDDLAATHSVVALAIREATFPDLPTTVARVRESYRLQCAADGMLYQFVLCEVARALGLEVCQVRRGEEIALAAAQLRVAPEQVDAFVSEAGRPAGPPWAHEHRRAFAAGIAVLSRYATLGMPASGYRVSGPGCPSGGARSR